MREKEGQGAGRRRPRDDREKEWLEAAARAPGEEFFVEMTPLFLNAFSTKRLALCP